MFRLNLTKKILIIFLVFTLIPLGFFAFITAQNVKKSIETQKIDDLMDIIDAKYVHTLDFIYAAKREAYNLSHDHIINESLKNPDLEKRKEFTTLTRALLTSRRNTSKLEEHSQKGNEEKTHIFGREVKWDIFNLDSEIYRYEEILVMDKNGTVISSSDEGSIGKDLSKNKAFTEGAKKIYINEPYEETNGKYIFGFSAPIHTNKDHPEDVIPTEEISGVVYIKADLEILSGIISGDIGNLTGGKLFFAGVGDEEEFYIVGEDKTMLTPSRILGKEASVMKQKVDTLPVQRCLDEKTEVREAQEIYKNYLGNDVGGASMCIFETKWTLVAEDSVDEMFSSINDIKEYILILGTLMFFLIITIGSCLVKIMTRPIKSSVHELNKSSDELKSSADFIVDDEKKISELVLEIKGGTEDQLKKIEEISRFSTEMSSAAEQIRTSSEDAASNAKKTSVSAQEGGVISETSLSNLENISNIVTNSTSMIKTLKNRSEEISTIMKAITEISEQTNLLALNAAIEAARAGEAGKGFSIVADEVRKLAEQTQKSVEQIEDLISSIQTQISDTVESMEGGSQEVGKGSEVIKKSLIFLQNIASASQIVSQKIDEISIATKKQSEHIDRTASAVNTLVIKAEKSNVSAQNIERRLDYLKNINTVITKINNIAKTLKKLF